LTDAESFAALLLLHHLTLEPYRGALQIQSIGNPQNPLGVRHKTVGACIGTLQSMMNHSCDTNTSVIMDRRRLLVHSLRSIKAGEQVYTSVVVLQETIMDMFDTQK